MSRANLAYPDSFTEYSPDAEFGGVAIEFKRHTRALRTVRESILQVAYWLTVRPDCTAVIVLFRPAISGNTLAQEWARARSALNEEIGSRMHLVVLRDSHQEWIPETAAPELRRKVTEFLKQEHGAAPGSASEAVRPAQRGQSFYHVLQILLHRRLLRLGPISTNLLMEHSGYSYPSVRNAVMLLQHSLERGKDRSLALKKFPTEEWQRLLANRDEFRRTIRFVDSSGRPRSADDHIKRLETLDPGQVALGGTHAARHYCPDLDLLGDPRLDLTVHSPDKSCSIGFIRALDPALIQSDDPGQPASVVVNFVTIPDSLFEPRREGLSWASPVHCLIDLLDMRLPAQAQQLLERFGKAHETSAWQNK